MPGRNFTTVYAIYILYAMQFQKGFEIPCPVVDSFVI